MHDLGGFIGAIQRPERGARLAPAIRDRHHILGQKIANGLKVAAGARLHQTLQQPHHRIPGGAKLHGAAPVLARARLTSLRQAVSLFSKTDAITA